MIKVLSPDEVSEAAALLRSDELVAIPTETVYGLGANALSAAAVRKIYTAKGRPSDNPLIIHVLGAENLHEYCREIPDTAYRVAERFWPGPVTMVLKKKAIISDFICAGLDTVAIRCPITEVTRKLLSMVSFPIAAPSANLSGRPSTTSVRHVIEDMGDRIPAVLDGGDCPVGLESTIIDLSGEIPTLLRPGGVTYEDLRELLGTVRIDEAVSRTLRADEKPKAPGMKYRHYAPKAPIVLVRGDSAMTAGYIAKHADAECGVLCFEEYVDVFPEKAIVQSLGSENHPEQQARRLFDLLRGFDATSATRIYAQYPSSAGIGMALENRLNKASGFQFIDADKAAE